ncbi:MAG: hypothetical protein LBK13_13350, partial [Spirochaetales bacterium]|nr:hypothetical protein [Spirochaetales bacterium]
RHPPVFSRYCRYAFPYIISGGSKSGNATNCPCPGKRTQGACFCERGFPGKRLAVIVLCKIAALRLRTQPVARSIAGGDIDVYRATLRAW